jgi:hypothetical protein
MESVGGNTAKFHEPQVTTTGVGVYLCSAKQYRAAIYVIILHSRCLIAEARSCITITLLQIQTDEMNFMYLGPTPRGGNLIRQTNPPFSS